LGVINNNRKQKAGFRESQESVSMEVQPISTKKGNIRTGHSLSYEDYEAFLEAGKVWRQFLKRDYKSII